MAIKLYETRVNLSLVREGVDYLTGDQFELDEDRAASINESMTSAFPDVSPILVEVGATAAPAINVSDDVNLDAMKKDEIKALLDEKGIEYGSRATVDELKALHDNA